MTEEELHKSIMRLEERLDIEEKDLAKITSEFDLHIAKKAATIDGINQEIKQLRMDLFALKGWK